MQVPAAKHPDIAPGDFDEKWVLGQWHFPDSSNIVWPAKRRTNPDGECFWFEPCTDRVRVKLVTLTNLDALAVTYEWRSWLWQLQQFDKKAWALGPAVRAFATGHPRAIKIIAALKAFFQTWIYRLEVYCFVPPHTFD